MPKRPEYIHCVLTGMYGGDPPVPLRETWCGKKTDQYTWNFVNASHAALNARNKGYLMACKACVRAITKAFEEHKE
jgi:hypothetical protein